MKAYTYLIKHIPTNQVYYGVRFANKVDPYEDLWKHYFTSSLRVQKLIEDTGLDSFEFEIRKTFDTKEDAIKWETCVLRRCKVLHNDRWLNANVAGHIVATDEGRKIISETHKGKPKTVEHKQKLSKSQKGSKRPWAIQNLPKDVSGDNNGMYGKKHTEESKKKIGEKNRVHMLGEKNPMKNIDWTPERRKAMGDKARGKTRPQSAIDAAAAKIRGQKRQKQYCPHCNRDIALGWYHIHGDKCKHR